MHGRLKVKTTAQQEAERKAQRQEKLQTYQAAMQAIFKNRQLLKEEPGDAKVNLIKAQMKMTSGVLMANPDISTLWNIRKQLLNEILDVKAEDHDVILRKELDLTVQCLQNNPKSYGAWHHRCWSMLRMVQPHWDYELMLCNKYLSLDERNFHCWDYRRFVVKHAEISPEDELEYTMERININFSNYSAWHYRSKLLPVIEKSEKISEAKRREELDLVLNAAFTDPEDSSAWFYHKWLLGRPEDVTKPVMIRHENDLLMIAFSRPVPSKNLRLFVNEIPQNETKWRSVLNKKFDTLWLTDLPIKESKICLELSNYSIETAKIGDIIQAKNEALDTETYGVLEQELQNCNELLELEPDSKWTLYTKVLIMKTMDPFEFHSEIVAGFETLCHIDAKRQGYYRDQRSKCIIDKAMSNLKNDKVDLSDSNLTALYFPEKFAFLSHVNLSRNELKCVDNLKSYLINCQELLLDENPMLKSKDIEEVGQETK